MILTPRQIEIAELVHGGARPGAVAHQLGISRSTVRAHMANARDRLGWDCTPIVALVRYYERYHTPSLTNRPAA